MNSAKRRFTHADQLDFARLSGDHNPVHLDTLRARRLMFGVPIVHGIHILLWAIGEQGRALPPRAIAKLKASFLHAIPVDADVECRWEESANPCRIELVCQAQTAGRIDMEWTHDEGIWIEPDDDIPPEEESRAVSREELPSRCGSVPLFLSRPAISSLLPEVARQLPASQTASLLATTRIIGVHCPGLNSVYSSLVFSNDEESQANNVDFRVKSFDERFGAVTVELKGPRWSGTANVFLRPEPTRQATYKSFLDKVQHGEFADMNALVVGGSRGLGEVAAKLLCAGGATVTLTYFSGRDDAQAIVDEINAAGGKARLLQFDVTASAPTGLPDTDLLVYMSTPFIFSAVKGRFNPELFQRFCSHYIDGFNRLCSELAARRPLRVLYPSSSAVDEVPGNMGEYAMAKAAAELLCRYLEGCHKGLKIHSPRFQRLATDQTGTIMPVRNDDPVPVTLQALRETIALHRSN